MLYFLIFQVTELNTKLSSENDRADKLAFDNAKLVEKLETLSVEKDRILMERNALKESNEELKLTVEVGSLSRLIYGYGHGLNFKGSVLVYYYSNCKGAPNLNIILN